MPQEMTCTACGKWTACYLLWEHWLCKDCIVEMRGMTDEELHDIEEEPYDKEE